MNIDILQKHLCLYISTKKDITLNKCIKIFIDALNADKK